MRSVIFPSFTYAQRGIFYFGRRVPKDLQRFYGSPKVVLSLRTKSVTKAGRQAQRIAAKLEEQWDLLRLVHLEGRVGNNRLEVSTSQSPLLVDTTPPLTKAAETYLVGKGSHRPKTFHQAVNRAVSNMIGLAGPSDRLLYPQPGEQIERQPAVFRPRNSKHTPTALHPLSAGQLRQQRAGP